MAGNFSWSSGRDMTNFSNSDDSANFSSSDTSATAGMTTFGTSGPISFTDAIPALIIVAITLVVRYGNR